MMRKLVLFVTVLAALFAVTAVALANGEVNGPFPGEAQQLNGSGATFPLNLYNAWNADYQALTGVQVNYAGGGSGRGQRDIIAGAVDFAGSDAFLSGAQLQNPIWGSILHVPAAMGGIAIIYNIPEIQGTRLELTGNDIAKIYRGEITNWNDPLLRAAPDGSAADVRNSELANVNRSILPVFRADASGTTFNFTYFLASENEQWRADRRVGTSINWLAGQSAQGNPGVANLVQQSPGAIGYVELSFVGSLDYAAVKNPQGDYIVPTPDSISLAADGVNIPSDSRIVLIYQSPNPAAYPISTFTWLLVGQNQRDAAKALALTRYLWWAVNDGQAYTENLGYAPLPDRVRTIAENIILSINNPDGSQALPTSIASR